jgi:phospholipid:diacylglycerol acyltransferase
MKRYNPAGVRIKTVELPHEPDRFDIRGGPTTGTFLTCHYAGALLTGPTADHVDILGRPDLNELILRVVAGHGEGIKESVLSRILEYSEKVTIHDDD